MSYTEAWEIVGAVIAALVVCLWCWYRGGWQEGYRVGWLEATHNWTDPK